MRSQALGGRLGELRRRRDEAEAELAERTAANTALEAQLAQEKAMCVEQKAAAAALEAQLAEEKAAISSAFRCGGALAGGAGGREGFCGSAGGAVGVKALVFVRLSCLSRRLRLLF